MANRSHVLGLVKSRLVDRETSEVGVGEFVRLGVDRVYVQDGNSPTVVRLFEEYGFTDVFDKSRVHFIFDHSVLPPSIEVAQRVADAQSFAETLGVDVLRTGEGISHVVAAERGWFAPGQVVLGSDSHTCAGGAYGALALGMGVSDIVAAMVTGYIWIKIPDTKHVKLVGEPSKGLAPRDIAMAMFSKFGGDYFLYRSIEVSGQFIECLSDDDAESFASLAVELGAKCVFLDRSNHRLDSTVDPDLFDIGALEPQVGVPHSPYNLKGLSEVAGQEIDMAFLGSCTNSRLSDLKVAADLLLGRKISKKVSLYVTPGSLAVYIEALRLGYIQTILEAGAIVTPPGCGSCVGAQGPIPADGQRVLSTMNRNFRGRMGNPNAEIYLSSPTVVIEGAIRGEIPDRRVIDEKEVV